MPPDTRFFFPLISIADLEMYAAIMPNYRLSKASMTVRQTWRLVQSDLPRNKPKRNFLIPENTSNNDNPEQPTASVYVGKRKRDDETINISSAGSNDKIRKVKKTRWNDYIPKKTIDVKYCPEYERSKANLCVICFENRRQIAFLHETSAHLSICCSCAGHSSLDTSKCPLCNVASERMIKVFQ